VMRCVLPFTLTTTAPDSRMASCTIVIDAAGVTASAEVEISQGWGVIVRSQPEPDAQPVHPTTTINGHRASTSQGGPLNNGVIMGHIRIDYGDRVVDFLGLIAHPPTLLQVAQGYRPIADEDPAHWPADPLP